MATKKTSKKASTKKVTHQMLTLMFVDIVNYTKTTTKLSRELFSDMHDVFDTLVMNAVDEYNGKIIKKIGDAFLITFPVATDGVQCGITMQKEFQEYNEDHDLPAPLRIRVAIHAGDVMIKDNDVYGDAVNMAARIEGLAKENDVVFSEAVYSAMNKGEIEYYHIGTRKVKGVEKPVRIFRAKTQKDIQREEAKRRRRAEIRNSKKIQNILAGVIIIILIAIIAFLGVVYFNEIMAILN